MVEFRIGDEALELDEGSELSFTWENNALHPMSYSFGRSVSFSIPKTPKNERILRNESNIVLGGIFSRSESQCDMYYSGGVMSGKLLINSFSENKYQACFVFGTKDFKLFLEAKISDSFGGFDKVSAQQSSITSDFVNFGFIRYISKQNGLTTMTPELAPNVNMLMSVRCRTILERLGLGYGLNPLPSSVENVIDYDYLMTGKFAPSATSSFSGNFGGSVIPAQLLSYVGITEDTGAEVKTYGQKPDTYVKIRRCFTAKENLNVTINGIYLNGVVMVERNGKWLTWGNRIFENGYDYGNPASLSSDHELGYLPYYIGIQIANQEISINKGERFVFLNAENPTYWLGFWGPGGYSLRKEPLLDYNMQDTNTFNVTVSFTPNDTVEYGEDVNVGGSLPDFTTFQFVSIFALINGYIPLFSTGGNNGVSVEFWNYSINLNTAIVLDDKLISVNKIERKFGDFLTRNNLKFANEIEKTYHSRNTTLGEYNIIDSKLKFAEIDGRFDDFKDGKMTDDSFIGYYSQTGDVAITRKAIVDNANLKKIIEKSTMIEVVVNMPLFRSLLLNEKQVFILNGLTYFCLSANFSEKTATLQLVLC